MRDVFIISDTHFGHANILKFTGRDGERIRPHWDDVQQMDEDMVTLWNSVVSDTDTVYHLGDVYLRDGAHVLPRLKGRKHLILGNHDNGKDPVLHEHFETIMMGHMLKDFNCLLTHLPVHASNLFSVEYNLHGHIHEKKSPTAKHVNCSVEVQDYLPKHIEELVPR